MGKWANSRLGESVSDLYRAKITLGKFKAVYSISVKTLFSRKFQESEVTTYKYLWWLDVTGYTEHR